MFSVCHVVLVVSEGLADTRLWELVHTVRWKTRNRVFDCVSKWFGSPSPYETCKPHRNCYGFRWSQNHRVLEAKGAQQGARLDFLHPIKRKQETLPTFVLPAICCVRTPGFSSSVSELCWIVICSEKGRSATYSFYDYLKWRSHMKGRHFLDESEPSPVPRKQGASRENPSDSLQWFHRVDN